jgi:hypothetical protein
MSNERLTALFQGAYITAMRVSKLPSPREVKGTSVKKIDEEREQLRKRMLLWDGGKQSRISLYDFANKAQLILELEGLGWKGFNGIAVEPADWIARREAKLMTPAELWESLEKEHTTVINTELARLQEDILPRIERDPHHRAVYTCSGLHPFVIQYIVQSLKDSGWWVEFAPSTMSVDKQLIIRPKEGSSE